MVLGDRFTHAMQAEYQGSAYFVVLNEDGTFKNNPDTFNEIFDDCRIIDDNISVVLAKGVLFREIPFSDKSALPREYMDSGTEMQRLFKKGQSYFVKIMPSGKYGWIRISKSSAVTILDNSKPQKTTNIGTDVFVQVEKNVSDINSVYSQLFSYLNKEYSSDKNAPYWKMQSSEDQILLTLNNAKAGQLKKSNAYFLNDLEHIFIGHKVVFETSPDSIKIYLNNEN